MDRRMYIGGGWCEASDGRRMEAVSPVHGEKIGTVPEGTGADVDRAVAAAREAQPILEAMDVDQRTALALQVADLIEADAEELARAETLDQGKPLHTEARDEVLAAAGMWRTASQVPQWTESQVLPLGQPRRLIYTLYQPRGVYGVVTPFNFPVALPQIYVPTALMAGNAVVWVPGPTVAWCTLRLAETLARADLLPAGALNVVTGQGAVVGDAVVGHEGTHAIVFVGSTGTGRQVARRAAGKPQILELGGNGPTVVLEDVDVGRSAETISRACFANAGQICTATERVLVAKKVHREFVEAMVEQANGVRLGNPFEETTTMGPLNNPGVVEKMDAHIADGVARGSRVLRGGKNDPGLGSPMYYEPTVIDGFAPDSLLNREESFGPLAKMQRFESEEEALALAASCPYGLAAAVFTADLGRAMTLTRKLKAGIVHVNEHTCSWDVRIPVGGFTGANSGMGRIGGKATYREMVNEKTVSVSWGA